MLGFDGRLGQNTVSHVLFDFGLRKCFGPDGDFIHSAVERSSVVDIQPNSGPKSPAFINGATVTLISTNLFSVNVENSDPIIRTIGAGEMMPFVFDWHPFWTWPMVPPGLSVRTVQR